ncbi:hypothetical protein ACJ73_02847 [Blastomyces percursus]|uniref:Major facilitator superfamily (MFS) profile domain-containing protein n=1 Tax=Blastomyces percursus TaxID=1658174 RepID=A0A1J9QB58_9EURO|nr:hypothetical protein ACJ73_02847 [Blastomyces percursus]
MTMLSFINQFGHPSPAIHGMIVSSILLSMALASLFAGSLSDNQGRSRAVAFGALMFAIGTTVEAGISVLGVFIFGWLIAGIGQGLFLSPLVVLAFHGDSRLSCRLESPCCLPQYLYSPCQNRPAGFITMVIEPQQKRPVPGLVSILLKVITKWMETHIHMSVETPKSCQQSWSRKQALLGIFLMSMQQLSGIDGAIYYAPLLFKQAGLSSSTASFLASGVSAVLLCLALIPAFLYADKIGRRASALYGDPCSPPSWR